MLPDGQVPQPSSSRSRTPTQGSGTDVATAVAPAIGRADDSLRASEERFRAVLENSIDAAYRRDLVLDCYDYVSPVIEQITGYAPDEFAGLTVEQVMERIHPDDIATVEGCMAEAKRSGTLRCDYRFVRKDGREIWMSDNARLSADENGDLRFLTGIVRDSTDAKRVESELRHANQLLTAHLQNSPVAIVEFDSEFRVIGWSREAERAFGYPADEILGKAIGDFKWVFEDDVEQVEAESLGLLDGSRPRSKSVNRNYRKDGSVIWCEWYSSAIYDQAGRLQSILSLVLDVTAQRYAEEKREQQLQRVELLKVVAEIGAESLTLQQAARRLVDVLMHGLATRTIALLIADQERRTLTPIALEGYGGEEATHLFRPVDIDGQGTSAAVYRSRQPLFIENALTDRSLTEPARMFNRSIGVGSGAALPIISSGRAIGVIALGWPEPRTFDEDEIGFIRSVAAQAAVAFESARLLERERERVRLGEILARIDRSVHSSLEVNDVVISALADGASAIGAESAAMAVIEDEGWTIEYDWGFDEPYVGRKIANEQNPHGVSAAKTGETIAIDDAFDDPRVDTATTRAWGVRSVIVAPLIVRGRPIAVLYYNFLSQRHHFSRDEIDFVTKVASSLSLGIENARHYEAEHRIAETLQETLVVLPAHVSGIMFSRAYQSATHETGRVGGDFVDVFEARNSTVAIALGDVSGKGVDAAVTTSLVRTTLRVHVIDGLDPAPIATKTNDVVRAFTRAESFVTVWFGLLNTKTGYLRYICAGHPPAVILDANGELREIECRDPILGAFDDVAFHESQATLASGDRLVLYSDGLTEARSPEGRFLGFDGLHEIVRRHASSPTSELADAIMADVVEFSGAVLRDDAAVLVVECPKLREHSPDDMQLRAFRDFS